VLFHGIKWVASVTLGAVTDCDRRLQIGASAEAQLLICSGLLKRQSTTALLNMVGCLMDQAADCRRMRLSLEVVNQLNAIKVSSLCNLYGHMVITLDACIYFGFCNSLDGRRPANLHMAQPNVPVSKTGHIPPARLVRGERCRETTLLLRSAGWW
jgi:hypothetical protein